MRIYLDKAEYKEILNAWVMFIIIATWNIKMINWISATIKNKVTSSILEEAENEAQIPKELLGSGLEASPSQYVDHDSIIKTFFVNVFAAFETYVEKFSFLNQSLMENERRKNLESLKEILLRLGLDSKEAETFHRNIKQYQRYRNLLAHHNDLKEDIDLFYVKTISENKSRDIKYESENFKIKKKKREVTFEYNISKEVVIGMIVYLWLLGSKMHFSQAMLFRKRGIICRPLAVL